MQGTFYTRRDYGTERRIVAAIRTGLRLYARAYDDNELTTEMYSCASEEGKYAPLPPGDVDDLLKMLHSGEISLHFYPRGEEEEEEA